MGFTSHVSPTCFSLFLLTSQYNKKTLNFLSPTAPLFIFLTVLNKENSQSLIKFPPYRPPFLSPFFTPPPHHWRLLLFSSSHLCFSFLLLFSAAASIFHLVSPLPHWVYAAASGEGCPSNPRFNFGFRFLIFFSWLFFMSGCYRSVFFI